MQKWLRKYVTVKTHSCNRIWTARAKLIRKQLDELYSLYPNQSEVLQIEILERLQARGQGILNGRAI